MGEIRYYTDEHISKAVIRGLRKRGVDVLTVPEAEKLGVADEEHIEFAMAEGRVMVTQDDDFLKLAAAGKPHSGIVFAQQHMSAGVVIRGLMLIHDFLQAEDMDGNIEFL